MNRRVYLPGVGIALVALALSLTDWALSLRPGVTETNARRIRPGMTLAEVETILGRAPVGIAREGDLSRNPDVQFGPEASEPALWVWSAEYGQIVVELGTDGRALRAICMLRRDPVNSGLLARLRAWLGW